MNRENYFRGVKDAIPIGLGYFAVSFSFGLQCGKGGLTVIQATMLSLLNLTSAGQFSGLSLIIAQASYLEMAFTQLIINLRYLLMSTSLSQKIDAKTGLVQRMIMAHGVTDEIFGLAMSQPALSTSYYYGLMTSGIIGWVGGTFVGVSSGSILSVNLLDALSITLYAMFLAIVIPPAKHDRTISYVVIGAMTLSTLFDVLPFNISSGFRIIIITLLISSLGAYLKPVEVDNG